jgi:hypothetical protein
MTSRHRAPGREKVTFTAPDEAERKLSPSVQQTEAET